jgi:hypothetical protein
LHQWIIHHIFSVLLPSITVNNHRASNPLLL